MSPTFLLRLPPQVRENLEQLKDKGQVKSLQALILQFIAEGLSKEGDFKAKELFAKDLHIALLQSSVQTNPNSAAVLTAHERALKDLEDQKLTSYASLLDPGLMAYRLLLDYASHDNKIRENIDIVRAFTEGLRQSARQAMERGKWGFAEALLLQACELVPDDNPNFRQETGIYQETGVYLARRFVRRWYRKSETLTAGVTNGDLLFPRFDIHEAKVGDTESPEDLSDWGVSKMVYEFMSTEGASHTSDMKCWKELAFIIECVTRPDGTGIEDLEKSEQDLLVRIEEAFREWERNFRMSRVTKDLQRGWATWLEPLELLWWLGYRSEAYRIAQETRGFTGDNSTTWRFNLLKGWDPSKERQLDPSEESRLDYQEESTQNLMVGDTFIELESDYYELQILDRSAQIFERPMSL